MRKVQVRRHRSVNNGHEQLLARILTTEAYPRLLLARVWLALLAASSELLPAHTPQRSLMPYLARPLPAMGRALPMVSPARRSLTNGAPTCHHVELVLGAAPPHALHLHALPLAITRDGGLPHHHARHILDLLPVPPAKSQNHSPPRTRHSPVQKNHAAQRQAHAGIL